MATSWPGFWGHLILRRIFRWRACSEARLSRGAIVWHPSVCAAVPIRVDGPGEVILCERVTLGYLPAVRVGSGEILLQARRSTAKVIIGAETIISNNTSIIAMEQVEIGANCQIGDMVLILDCDFHEIAPATRNNSAGIIAPVSIGRNVWLGSRVVVLKGVIIGENTVVAAGSLVNKGLPANVVAAGVPAKIIRKLT